jgi:hypothetical protein
LVLAKEEGFDVQIKQEKCRVEVVAKEHRKRERAGERFSFECDGRDRRESDEAGTWDKLKGAWVGRNKDRDRQGKTALVCHVWRG